MRSKKLILLLASFAAVSLHTPYAQANARHQLAHGREALTLLDSDGAEAETVISQRPDAEGRLNGAGEVDSRPRSRRTLETVSVLDREKKVRKGRVGKRGRARARELERAIPDVSLASTNDLWEERDKRRSLLTAEPEGQQPSALNQDVFPISSTQLRRQQDGVTSKLAQQSSGQRRHLMIHPSKSTRGMQNTRPNGVSEMPDPEAAEYLAQHQSQDLGRDVVDSARTHYNGTEHGQHKPASTDRHATLEERMTVSSDGGSESQAVAGAESSSEPSEVYGDGAYSQPEGKPAQVDKKQEGFPWYTQFPPPSFPHDNLTVTNHSIHHDLKAAVLAAAEEQRKAAEAKLAERAKQAQAARATQKLSVAEMTRQNLAAEVGARASIWAPGGPSGPGDGGEPPPGTHIFKASGEGEETPAKSAREKLNLMRSQARVWMSMQEASIIESYLQPTDTMLEFGAGYSTTWFSQFVKEYYSIEHNATWFDEIKTYINNTRKNVHLQVAPVAKGHRGWGGGFEEGTYDQFQHYIKAVDNFKVNSFDRVLVDGRARASCAEYVLKFLHPGSLVFIHDYQDRFFYHGVVERYYTKVAETYDGQTLIVARPRPEALQQAAREAVASLASSKRKQERL